MAVQLAPKNASTFLFFTGISGAGKTTLAERVAIDLKDAPIIDGDMLRKAYKDDLPHGLDGVKENTRRLTEVALKMLESSPFVLAAFVAPLANMRAEVRKAVEGAGSRFIEIWVRASVDTCRNRDTKGLYRRQAKGEDIHLAGVNVPYDIPKAAEIICQTDDSSIDDCVKQIIQTLNIQ